MPSRVPDRELPSVTDSGHREAPRESLSLNGDDHRRAGVPTDPRFSLSSDPGRTARVAVARRPRGVTLVELLVVIGVVGVLLAILAAALGGARHAARETQGASQTRQIGLATIAFMKDHRGALPQVRLDAQGRIASGPSSFHVPFLFGGARSIVDLFGASAFGVDRRPLNPYLDIHDAHASAEIFRDPLDSGTDDSQLTGFAPHLREPTVFDLVGTSYVLNDHALDTVPCPFVELFDTLIPPGGGPAPLVHAPSRTWLAGQSPIYNYDDGQDKRQLWGRDRVRASLAFVDGHVKVAVPVPPGPVNTTPDYTFFPQPDWPDRFPPLGFGP